MRSSISLLRTTDSPQEGVQIISYFFEIVIEYGVQHLLNSEVVYKENHHHFKITVISQVVLLLQLKVLFLIVKSLIAGAYEVLANTHAQMGPHIAHLLLSFVYNMSHALTLTATQPITRIDSNSIPTFRRVAFKRQIGKFCVHSIYLSLAKFNTTHIVNQALGVSIVSMELISD